MKKLITIFSFLILTSTVFANSVGGSIGGWQVVSNVASGIGAKLTATKDVMINGASKTLSATANITPNPTNVAKFLAKAGGLALADIALRELMKGVDFVMDPSNNTIQYKVTTESKNWTVAGQNFYNMTLEQACKSARAGYLRHNSNQCIYGYIDESGKEVTQAFWGYLALTAPETEQRSVALSTVASTVIDQAEKDIKAGNPTSPAVALSRVVAQDIVVEAETDNVKARPIVQQLEQSQTYPTTEDATGTVDTPAVTDPVTGEVVKPPQTSDIQMKFPKACEWFPQLCVFIDWMQKDPELDEDLDVPMEEKAKKEINENLVQISSSTCPAPYPVEINLPVLKTTYTDSIDISPYCPEIEKLAPVLQLLAFVLAVMIIKDI
jgi:hypothetical protein